MKKEFLNSDSPENFTAKSLLRQNKGQLIVEYILLMVIVVSVCALLTRTLVGRGDESGVIIQKWSQLNSMVGQDIGD